jgi:glycosyltransferase involved in cell wall biosynthesis
MSFIEKIKKPLSVCFVITNLDCGGAEAMLLRLLSQLDRNRFTVQVISLVGIGHIGKKIQALGIPVRALGMHPGRPSLNALLQLVRWLRQDQPDLIQTWMYHADLMGGIAARLAGGGVPLVWGIRQSNLGPEGNGRFTVLTVKACAWLSRWMPDRIVCCSEASRQVHAALGYSADKMIMIPNGYDGTVFRPNSAASESVRKELQIPGGASVIGMVARFHPQKDHDNFIQAAGLLHKKNPNVYFVLCGYGVDWENRQLSRWIEDAGIRGQVYLLGQRDDIPHLTAALDIATLSSSYGEGFPNVVSEAMSCEVPCVVTDVGDAALIVGETGIVISPRNPATLAEAWQTMLDLGREGRMRLGKAARQRIKEEFDLPKIVARYEKLFEDLAHTAPR